MDQEIRTATLSFFQQLNNQERAASDLRKAKRLARLNAEAEQRKQDAQCVRDCISSMA